MATVLRLQSSSMCSTSYGRAPVDVFPCRVHHSSGGLHPTAAVRSRSHGALLVRSSATAVKERQRPGEKKGCLLVLCMPCLVRCQASLHAGLLLVCMPRRAGREICTFTLAGFVEEMRMAAMKLHTRDQAPKQGSRPENENPVQQVRTRVFLLAVDVAVFAEAVALLPDFDTTRTVDALQTRIFALPGRVQGCLRRPRADCRGGFKARVYVCRLEMQARQQLLLCYESFRGYQMLVSTCRCRLP